MNEDATILEHDEHEAHSPRRDQSILNMIPEDAGPRLATARGGVFYSVCPSGSQTLQPAIHFASVMLAPAQENRAPLGCGKLIEHDALVGALIVHPANVEGQAVWSNPGENLIVAIRPEGLLELAADGFGADDVSLRPPPFGTVDFEALRMAELLKMELTRPYPPNELYVDSLVMLFGLHLLRNYAEMKKVTSVRRDGLPARSEKRVREFLQENFTHKLSVAEIAAVANLSPFHFLRTFKKTFGQTPHQYVLNLRLNFAERLLSEGDLAISEIAYLSGFSSQSHLAAVMRTHRQTTPAKIRRGVGKLRQI